MSPPVDRKNFKVSRWQDPDEVRKVKYEGLLNASKYSLEWDDLEPFFEKKDIKRANDAFDVNDAFDFQGHIEGADIEFEKVKNGLADYAEEVNKPLVRGDAQHQVVEQEQANLWRVADVCETGDWFPNEIENLGFYERDNRDFVYMKITDGPRSKTAYSWMKSVNGEPKHAHGRFVVGILYLKPRQEGRVNLDYLLYWVNNNKSLRGFGLRALEERLMASFLFLPSMEMQENLVKQLKNPFGRSILGQSKGQGWTQGDKARVGRLSFSLPGVLRIALPQSGAILKA